jgi:hypothetical protein
MSFHKLPKDERAAWRDLPVSKVLFAFLREARANSVRESLTAALKGEVAVAAGHAGSERTIGYLLDVLEND